MQLDQFEAQLRNEVAQNSVNVEALPETVLDLVAVTLQQAHGQIDEFMSRVEAVLLKGEQVAVAEGEMTDKQKLWNAVYQRRSLGVNQQKASGEDEKGRHMTEWEKNMMGKYF